MTGPCTSRRGDGDDASGCIARPHAEPLVAELHETLEPLVDLGKRPIRRPRDPATDRPTRMLPRVDSGAAPPQNGQ